MSGCLHRKVKRTTIIQISLIVINIVILIGLFQQDLAGPKCIVFAPVTKNQLWVLISREQPQEVWGAMVHGNCIFE
jgi:hypothetical protein